MDEMNNNNNNNFNNNYNNRTNIGDNELTYLVSYKGHEDYFIQNYQSQIERMGFNLQKKFYLKSLDKLILKYSYNGNNLDDDLLKLKSIDDNLSIEINKTYQNLKK